MLDVRGHADNRRAEAKQARRRAYRQVVSSSCPTPGSLEALGCAGQYGIARPWRPSRCRPAARMAPMAESARMFLCARCHVQVLVCRRCDRGQIYCEGDCAIQSRRQAQRAAARRYQCSRAGRFAHADRARRYRARRKIVTHQGSLTTASGDLLPAKVVVSASRRAPEGGTRSIPGGTTGYRCAYCQRPCAQAVRNGFLRRSSRRARRASSGNRAANHDDHRP